MGKLAPGTEKFLAFFVYLRKRTNMTQEESRLICRAAMDIESGNYLLRSRTHSEIAMLNEVMDTIDTPEDERTDRQKEIFEEYRLCTDYDYWKEKNNE